MKKQEYIPRIGIEIHTVLKTKKKIFSKTNLKCGDLEETPNSSINNIDLALPGTLPVFDYESIDKAIKLSKILNCKLKNEINVKRKNYFYVDLPKGFQLSQYLDYFSYDGYLNIFLKNQEKKIRIRNIQLEEDTAKQKFKNKKIELDFNRVGLPLVEIITQPDFNNADEVIVFMKLIKILLKQYDISDASFEMGTIRVDINISLDINNKINNPVEIKNLNTYKNIRNAINNEIDIQTKIYDNSQEVIRCTKKFNEQTKSLEFMRKKHTENDYFFIFDPNIPIIDITKIINQYANKNYDFTKKYEYIAKIDNGSYLNIIYAKKDVQKFIILKDDYKKTNFWHFFFKFIINKNINILKNYKKINIFYEFIFSNYISEEIKNNNRFIDDLFWRYINESENLHKIYNEMSRNLLSNEKLESIILNIVKSNKIILKDYYKNPIKYERILMGKIMKEIKGATNPKICLELLKNIINKVL